MALLQGARQCTLTSGASFLASRLISVSCVCCSFLGFTPLVDVTFLSFMSALLLMCVVVDFLTVCSQPVDRRISFSHYLFSFSVAFMHAQSMQHTQTPSRICLRSGICPRACLCSFSAVVCFVAYVGAKTLTYEQAMYPSYGNCVMHLSPFLPGSSSVRLCITSAS